MSLYCQFCENQNVKLAGLHWSREKQCLPVVNAILAVFVSRSVESIVLARASSQIGQEVLKSEYGV